MASASWTVLGAIAIATISVNVSAAIVLTDFSNGTGGWTYVGAATKATDGSMEVVTTGTSDKALRLNYIPTTSSGSDVYNGWVGTAKTWDNSQQQNVTSFTISLSSNKPWRIFVYAMFDGVGEKLKVMYWPNGTSALDATTFGVTAAQFATIEGIRISLDSSAATNGGGRTSPDPMWVQINSVVLNGDSVPEGASLTLLSACSIALLARRR